MNAHPEHARTKRKAVHRTVPVSHQARHKQDVGYQGRNLFHQLAEHQNQLLVSASHMFAGLAKVMALLACQLTPAAISSA